MRSALMGRYKLFQLFYPVHSLAKLSSHEKYTQTIENGCKYIPEAFAFGRLTLVFTMRTALKVGISIGLAPKAKFDINLADITSASTLHMEIRLDDKR